MQPRLSGEPNPAWLIRPVSYLILAGLGTRLPSQVDKWLPTQPKHNTAILVSFNRQPRRSD